MFKIISIILIWAFISPVTTFSGKNNLGMPVTQCRTNTLSPHLSLSRESVQFAISEYISAISKSMAQEIPVLPIDLIGGKFFNLMQIQKQLQKSYLLKNKNINMGIPFEIFKTTDFKRFLMDNQEFVKNGERYVRLLKQGENIEISKLLDVLLRGVVFKDWIQEKVDKITAHLQKDKEYLVRTSNQREGLPELSRSGVFLSEKVTDTSELFKTIKNCYLDTLRKIWEQEQESIWDNLSALGIVEYINFDYGIIGSYSQEDGSTIMEVVVGGLETAVEPGRFIEAGKRQRYGATVITIKVKNGKIYLSKEFRNSPAEIIYKSKHYLKEEDTKIIWQQLTQPLDAENVQGMRCPLTKEEIFALHNLMRQAPGKLWEIGKQGIIGEKDYTLTVLQADPMESLGKYQPMPKNLDNIMAETFISQGNADLKGHILLVEENADPGFIEYICKELNRNGIQIIKVQRGAGGISVGENKLAGVDYIEEWGT